MLCAAIATAAVLACSAPALEAQSSEIQVPRESPLVRGGGRAAPVRLDVRDFGARGDGVHDDRASIEAAQAALPPEGGTLFFPEGVYSVGEAPIVLRRSGLRLEGQGRRSVLRKIRAGGPLLATSPAHPGLRDLRVRGLRFEVDLGAERTAVEIAIQLGHGMREVAIEDCEFWDLRDYALLLRGVDGVVVDGCRFDSPGAARGTGIQIGGNPRRVLVRGSSFRFLRRGFVVSANPHRGEIAEDVVVEGNHFDLGWWSIAAIAAGEGPSVRYTESGLSDSAARFDALGLVSAKGGLQHDVRAMPVRRRGAGRYAGTVLEDAGADFVASGVRPGEIVRTASAFGLVEQVEAPGRLRVEEWLSRSSYLPIAAPPDGTPYTLYGIYLGRGAYAGGTIFAVRRWAGWFDLDGNRVVPSPGTRYEILVERPDYPCHAEGGTRRIAVRDNVFLRGWSDQISLFGNEAAVTGNRVAGGQDMGITVHGRRNLVARNQVRHQGAAGIWAAVEESAIEDNIVTDSQWVNAQAASLSDITLRHARDTVVARNRCERRRTKGEGGLLALGFTMPLAGPRGARGSDSLVAAHECAIDSILEAKGGSGVTDEGSPP